MRMPWVYPRVCGGTPSDWGLTLPIRGLSPRVRGNQLAEELREPRAGSIPACAGEPRKAPAAAAVSRVYPRVCGGTVELRLLRVHPLRSIPACAGEPPGVRSPARSDRVYPRVCGGTSRVPDPLNQGKGLSPRVRGNLLSGFRARKDDGSIPACAGEPSTMPVARGFCQVYPRVCGGTLATLGQSVTPPGLSPRVRGNQHDPVRGDRTGGSIPACAGEPRSISGRTVCWRVYPRVCGGTQPPPVGLTREPGLSPRVRGNPAPRAPRCHRCGSIPACAGEPSCAPCGAAARAVYPRVCGGTNVAPREQEERRGLSPRVRGNRSAAGCAAPSPRSIPACAGEPASPSTTWTRPRVYPRVCGGTVSIHWVSTRPTGLSPRVRGNLSLDGRVDVELGSIPACAGEPRRR